MVTIIIYLIYLQKQFKLYFVDRTILLGRINVNKWFSCVSQPSRFPFSTLSYPDEDLQPLQPLAMVLEEVLQFPNVLQQVRLCGRLTHSHLGHSRVVWCSGHVLHQHILPPWRDLGMRNWGKGRETERREVSGSFWGLVRSIPHQCQNH